jgi:hypothetical protein
LYLQTELEIEKWWWLVDAIAKELIKHKTLLPKQIRTAIRAAHDKKYPPLSDAAMQAIVKRIHGPGDHVPWSESDGARAASE